MLTAVRVLIECETSTGERLSVDLQRRGAQVAADPLDVVNAAVDRVRAAMVASEPGPPRTPARSRK